MKRDGEFQDLYILISIGGDTEYEHVPAYLLVLIRWRGKLAADLPMLWRPTTTDLSSSKSNTKLGKVKFG